MSTDRGTSKRDFIDMFDFLQKSISIAKSAGISDEKIILDGGIGFGKNKEQNFTVVNN